MTFQLKSLGPYRIERTEEYIPGAQENSYAEMIRIRGSKPEPPVFMVPSHLYKYSESELGLYLKERKNRWRELGELLGVEIDIHDNELIVNFPISMFSKVSEIVPFVRKALRKNPLTEEEKRKMVLNLHRERSSMTGGMRKNDPNFNESAPDGNSIPTLDNFAILEGSE